MGNQYGKLFRIATWGESHGNGVGVVIDGCPPGVPLSVDEIQQELDRRRPGQSDITTPRKEADTVTILSGVDQGVTLGTPIALNVFNKDARGTSYDEMKKTFRPSHADFTYEAKFGRRMAEGGGRSSARETIGRVAAGAIARKILKHAFNLDIIAYVERVQDISMPPLETPPSLDLVEANAIRCPHPETAERMIERIKAVRAEGDSIGGIIRAHLSNVPPGWGEPVFDRLEADLAKAMLSLPATKGFEVGSGFAGTYLKGSAHNDPFINKDGKIRTTTNNSGGVQGGISNGEEIHFRVAFKPTATIIQKQQTVNREGQPIELMGKGRHDPCVLPRAVPIVEAMAALVLLDHAMRHFAQNVAFKNTEYSSTEL